MPSRRRHHRDSRSSSRHRSNDAKYTSPDYSQNRSPAGKHSSRYSRSPDRSIDRRRRRSSHSRRRDDERTSRKRDTRDSSHYWRSRRSPPRISQRGESPRRSSRTPSKNRNGSRDRQEEKTGDRAITSRPDITRESPLKKTRVAESPVKPLKRAWKFDSPPRDELFGVDGFGSGTGIVTSTSAGPLSVNGVPGTISQLLSGDAPAQPSAMNIMAQSLGLSSEQQKAARELYVGNLPPSLDVNQLIDFFNAAMLTLNSSSIPGNPVLRAWIATDGHFAFVEFRTIEEATIALQLNGLNCMGYALRIGRPKTYPSEYGSLLSSTVTSSFPVDVTQANPAAAALAAATAAAQSVGTSGAGAMRVAQLATAGIGIKKPVIDRPDRLVLLDLPPAEIYSEEEIKRLVESYGKLKIFQYFEVPKTEDVKNATGACIFEYTELGQQKALEKAIRDDDFGEGLKARMVSAEQAIREGRLTETMQKAGLVELLGGDLMRPQVATRVIMLTNLVTRAELLDEKEYFDIVDDVNIECSHYGKVVSVEIPRPIGATPEGDESDIGYAFVRFARLQGAGTARKGLSGRKFAGRTVEAHYFSEKRFDQKSFKAPRPNFDVSERVFDSPIDPPEGEVTSKNGFSEGSSIGRFDVGPSLS